MLDITNWISFSRDEKSPLGVIKATAKAMMAAGRGVQCQQNGEGLISTWAVCKNLIGPGTALAKEYIERRLVEPVE